MRIPINLSTEPFRRDRPALMATAAVAVVLVLLLCVLGYLIAADRARVKDTRVAVERLLGRGEGLRSPICEGRAILAPQKHANVCRHYR